MCRPIGKVLAVLDHQDVGAGGRRVPVKKLAHFVKNLRRSAKPLAAGEKPWWKMLALHSGMERLRLEAGAGRPSGRPERAPERGAAAERAERAAQAQVRRTVRTVDCAVDRAVRLAAVATDLQLDLPPSIALPDGEEVPHGASARLHIRDPEQESEIYQKCIRPPPNRTVFDGESPPPYRPSHAPPGLGPGHGPGQPRYQQHGPCLVPCPPCPPCPGACHGHAPCPCPPTVIVPSRKLDAPAALFLAGTGKHSTHPSGPAAGVPGPAAAAGLLRLLSPGERLSTASSTTSSTSLCRTAESSAQSVEQLVNVSSTSGDIPGSLASLTMVPCLTESRTDSETTSRTESIRPRPPV